MDPQSYYLRRVHSLIAPYLGQSHEYFRQVSKVKGIVELWWSWQLLNQYLLIELNRGTDYVLWEALKALIKLLKISLKYLREYMIDSKTSWIGETNNIKVSYESSAQII